MTGLTHPSRPAGNRAGTMFAKLLVPYADTPDAVHFYAPGEQALFDAFCAQMLPGRQQPLLIVIEDHAFHQHEDADIPAYYQRDSNCIVMCRSQFDGFCAGEPMPSYIAAHELGHAVYHHSRRNLLKMGAATGVSIAAGGLAFGGARTAINAAAGKPQKSIDSADLLEAPLGMAAAYMAWKAVRSRQDCEELEADHFATQALSAEQILECYTVDVEEMLREQGRGVQCEQWRAEIAERARVLGWDTELCADAMNWAFAMRMAFEMRDQWHDCSIKGYVTPSERLQAMCHRVEAQQATQLLY